jgi:predicted TIM-barrel fold metal-dependent hydrolase
LKKYPGRFAWLGGGESLNIMIHKAAKKRTVDSSLKKRFRETALNILDKGAVGLGEFAVEHFSFNHDHPYESVPADHPLFLLLADIAAERGVPVDIHMVAVPGDMPLPKRRILLRSGRNPDMLRENITAFERLLRHNRGAKIIWSHVGWCNTGYRTTELCEKLLKRHPNLYIGFKLSRESVPETRPLTEDKSRIKTAWLGLMQAFPDRFVIGTDQFYTPPGGRAIGPQKTEDTKRFMILLPPDLARSIGIENPRRIFGLKP